MTIDHTTRPASARILRALGILIAVAIGWFASMAAFMAVTEAAPAALVITPRAGFMQSAPEDTRVMRGGGMVTVVVSEETGYVQRLYAAGAWLVLPALRNGCLDIGRKIPRQQS